MDTIQNQKNKIYLSNEIGVKIFDSIHSYIPDGELFSTISLGDSSFNSKFVIRIAPETQGYADITFLLFTRYCIFAYKVGASYYGLVTWYKRNTLMAWPAGYEDYFIDKVADDSTYFDIKVGYEWEDARVLGYTNHAWKITEEPWYDDPED